MAEINYTNPLPRIDQLVAEGKLSEAHQRYGEFLRRCQEELDVLTQNQGRFARLERDAQLGIDSGMTFEHNKIQWDFLTQLDRFRREVIGSFFDIRNRDEFFSKIENRDTIINDLLDIRLRPKNYLRDERLTEGNSSIVYRLTNHVTRRHAVALVLKMPYISDKAKQEIERLTDLRHRNVIKILDHDLEAFPYFVITDYVHGTNLVNALQQTGPRPAPQAMDWLYQLADALDYLRHRGVTHTNIRPSKIYVDDEWHMMISPLDLHRVSTGEMTYNRFVDICLYDSPEGLRRYGPQHSTEAATQMPAPSLEEAHLSDQYCIGLIAYRILTGRRMFEGSSIVEILESRKRFATDKAWRKSRLDAFPDWSFFSADGKKLNLATILRRFLSENPADRFSDFNQVLRMLHPLTRAEVSDSSLARRSYRRCLSTNREFIKNFYDVFFEKLPEVKKDFTLLGQKRLSAMLQMSVDVLLDLEHKKHLLVNILQREQHAGYSVAQFRIFLETLLETVERQDPHWDASVAADWQMVMSKTLAIMEELRK
jgi:serine/threonine protein kinase